MSLRLIGDLKDGISERLIYHHANKDSSIGLHTSYEAHKAHMDTLAHGIDRMAQGEHPTFDTDKLTTIAQNSIEDPHFKSHLPLEDPQPVKHQIPEIAEKPFDTKAKTPFFDIDEHASHRYAELEARSPEVAKDVHERVKEDVDSNTIAKKHNLYQVAIDCFLRTGGN